MVEAVDASLYAEREDRHTILTDGGAISFIIDPTTDKGRLTWETNIRIPAPITGFYWFIAPSYVDLLEGQTLYVNVPRAPTQNTAVLAQVASQVPSTDADLLVGIRRGTQFYFRNGRSIKDGETSNVLEDSSGGGGGGSTKGFKAPCVVASQGDLDITNPPSAVDGRTLVVGDRVLVLRQGASYQNGIYALRTIGSPNVWARATDFNDTASVQGGSLVVVTQGTDADCLFELATNDPITVGVTGLNFVVVGSNISSSTPEAITAGATGSAGIAGSSARGDHQHPVSTGLVGNIVAITSATPASAGTAASLARSDHRHLLQVDFAQGGAVIGSRPTINFTSGVALTDNSGANRVDAAVTVLGTTGQVLRSSIPIVLGQSNNLGVDLIAGNYAFALGDYALAGTTATVFFKVCGFVSVSGVTGTIELWNVTDNALVDPRTFSTVGISESVSASLGLSSSQKFYEIRIRVSAGTGSVYCQWAGLEVRNTVS
jgi:hypothetical protein